MKIRNMPFGYRYDNGTIGYDQAEKPIFLRMTDMYLAGMSLREIADTFNKENIEYAPGIIGWNKSRIMRLLSDERYTGSGKYPAIISREIYDLILAQRDNNNLLSDVNLHSEIHSLDVPVTCPDCGKPMKRIVASRKKAHVYWHCKSCGIKVFMEDDELIAGIEKQLTRLTDQPELIRVEESPSVIDENKEVSDLSMDIEWTLERPDIEVELALEKIRNLAALRYKAISEEYYTALRVKADFLKSYQIYDDSRDRWRASMIGLANRTVKEIHISDVGQVSIVLRNGQISPEGA